MLDILNVRLSDCMDPREAAVQRFVGICAEVLHQHDTASRKARQLYHDTKHSLSDVTIGARTVHKRIVGLWPCIDPDNSLQIVRMAAAAHDLYQNFETETGDHGRLVRKRDRGPNEQRTAAAARQLLRDLATHYGAEFSELEYKALYEAIICTFPEWDAGHEGAYNTIIQPQLHELLKQLHTDGTDGLHPAMFALAMGDLAAPGINAPLALRGGDLEFQEFEVGITRDLAAARIENSRSVVPESKWSEYLDVMKKWDQSQYHFFGNRSTVFMDETGCFPVIQRRALRDRFNQYDVTVAQSRLRTERRSGIECMWEYAFEMGYEVPML